MNFKDQKEYFLQAITDTVIIEMKLPTLLTLSQSNLRMFQFVFFNIADHMNALLERVENLITMKPEERVGFLLKYKADLLESIPHKYLAEYVGITPVSLSRLLKKVNRD